MGNEPSPEDGVRNLPWNGHSEATARKWRQGKPETVASEALETGMTLERCLPNGHEAFRKRLAVCCKRGICEIEAEAQDVAP